jgi:hypothetical protein
MTKTIAMITAAMILSTSVTAQSNMHVVANAYEQAGCTGGRTKIAAVPVNECINVKTQCRSSSEFEFVCRFLETMTVKNDRDSFRLTCDGGKGMIETWTGENCKDGKFAERVINIPEKTCIQNFKIACSTDPKLAIDSAPPKNDTTNNSTNGTTNNAYKNMQGGILGLLGLLFV